MMISLGAVCNRTRECIVISINNANIRSTSCTFLKDQFSTTTIIWRQVITLPFNMVHDATLQDFGNSYALEFGFVV